MDRGASSDAGEDLADLVAMVAGGDRAAFGRLYARTSGKLFASVRRILGNQAAAEDAVQEAYVRVWRRAGDFDRSIASPIAWMTTIARHAAIDSLRRGAERVASAANPIDADLADRLADAEATIPSGGGRGLTGCLNGLDEERRTMVVLAYSYGWSREELAERFKRPVATVKTLLRRALIALKECLGG
ncbi:MAG TPA: sigma-70 family RNA polymerase sigma factor [Bauldia sp.]|nr:sigma-70 family RNA polymerase sigma factor [Bauldia sp.]